MNVDDCTFEEDCVANLLLNSTVEGLELNIRVESAGIVCTRVESGSEENTNVD